MCETMRSDDHQRANEADAVFRTHSPRPRALFHMFKALELRRNASMIYSCSVLIRSSTFSFLLSLSLAQVFNLRHRHRFLFA